MDSLRYGLGKRVRELRLAAGISSQEELGSKAGFHRTFIGRVERGETDVTLSTLARLANALQVPISRLLDGVEDQAC